MPSDERGEFGTGAHRASNGFRYRQQAMEMGAGGHDARAAGRAFGPRRSSTRRWCRTRAVIQPIGPVVGNRLRVGIRQRCCAASSAFVHPRLVEIIPPGKVAAATSRRARRPRAHMRARPQPDTD